VREKGCVKKGGEKEANPGKAGKDRGRMSRESKRKARDRQCKKKGDRYDSEQLQKNRREGILEGGWRQKGYDSLIQLEGLVAIEGERGREGPEGKGG